MNTRIGLLAEQLRQAVMDECSYNTVGFQVLITSNGCGYEITERTHKSLKRDGISMQNLKGEFIKENR